MEQAQCRDASIVDQRPCDSSFLKHYPESRPVTPIFIQNYDARGFQPRVNLVNGRGHRCGRRIDAGVRHDGQKLMHAWPGNCPRAATFAQLSESSRGGIVPR